MDIIFIIGAKYFFLLSGVLALIGFWKLSKQEKKAIIIFGIITVPLIFLVSKIGAWLYFDPRPFVENHTTPLIPHDPDNGFPSDHMLLVSAVAAIFFPFDKKTSASVWIVAIIVGISRVYVGIHHATDVIGSAVISTAVTAIVYFFIGKRIRIK